MNRRLFLQFLSGTALAATYDWEKLLWVPKPMIVVPELPKIYAPGNFWIERNGEGMAFVGPKGISYYFNQYEVDRALADIYKEYKEIELRYRER